MNARGGLPTKPPLESSKLAIITFALPLATFMQVVDATIANVAVPTIAGNLGASYSQGTWIITSYGVANAIVLPLTGRLAQKFGEVRLFLWSTALFALASMACGLSGSLTALVIWRIVQGIAGGPMMPLAQTLLMNNYPRERQIMALALWSMTVSVAPVMGPIMGGVISDSYHWSWIFFINVPVGALVILLTRYGLRHRETQLSVPRWSAVSFGLLALGVGSLQMMLDRGKELDWFNSGTIVVLGLTALVGVTLLLVWESRNSEPLIDLSLFKSRNYSIGVSLISLGMMLYMGIVVLFPLLLQSRFGYTATWAGLATAPVGIIPILTTPLVGRLLSKIDVRYIITFSFSIFALVLFYRSNFSPQADLAFMVYPQLVLGIAIACFFVPITSLTFIGMNPAKIAGASGIFNCIRTIFAAIGASAVTTLWERREAFHHVRLSGLVDTYNPLVVSSMESLRSLGMSQEQINAFINRQITSQGFILAAAEIFKLCGVIFILLIGVCWLAKPRLKQSFPGGGPPRS
ncbi:MAG: DHA2 family efflux MFS transporter permease subunit [Deltaproteobacteria bacterium]|jgi:DHA2 family multidrug resistance protein|nr:DHA2 family efflux MFS transporter permease subunit [Deltaproteobacteria bacterium]